MTYNLDIHPHSEVMILPFLCSSICSSSGLSGQERKLVYSAEDEAWGPLSCPGIATGGDWSSLLVHPPSSLYHVHATAPMTCSPALSGRPPLSPWQPAGHSSSTCTDVPLRKRGGDETEDKSTSYRRAMNLTQPFQTMMGRSRHPVPSVSVLQPLPYFLTDSDELCRGHRKQTFVSAHVEKLACPHQTSVCVTQAVCSHISFPYFWTLIFYSTSESVLLLLFYLS